MKPASTALRLLPLEITQCHKDGNCFHCDEFFMDCHDDQCKRFFIIEVVDEGDTAAAIGDDEPTISLHALMGIQFRSSGTVQHLVHVNGASLMVLLDSGSTHNFIDEQEATRAGITLSGTGHL
jgi:hypothetical protein